MVRMGNSFPAPVRILAKVPITITWSLSEGEVTGVDFKGCLEGDVGG